MLDEMFSPRVGQLLRQRGIDCVSVADDRLLSAQDDATVLAAALDQERVLATNDVLDFEPLRRQRVALGEPVPSLIYTDDATFPRNRDYVGQLTAALAAAASSHLVSACGGVLWLSRPRQDSDLRR